MSVRKLVSRFSWVAVAACALLVAGCGSTGGPATAKVKSGPMPDGASWSGVYYSPLYGYLHLVQEDQLVTGKWLRPRKDRWGELQGNVKGNLMRFDWKEYVIGTVGPNTRKSGKGYFVYSRPEGENQDDRIAGEIGKGEDETGSPWEGLKQRNTDPDLDSIGGTGEVGSGGVWDGKNEEDPSEVEPPVEPPEPDEGPVLDD